MKDVVLEQQALRHQKWTRSRKFSGTAGSFLKSYDDTGERKLYYKLSDYDSTQGITGHECVNEIIAQRILALWGIPHLKYRLLRALIAVEGREYETYLCESEDFKEKNESKIPLEDYYAMEKQNGESPLDFCIRMQWSDQVYAMLAIDFLIHNRDRHGANIEVLLNTETKKIRLAPLSDQGLSFVCRCKNETELQVFDVMNDGKVQAFIGTGSVFSNITLVPREYLQNLRTITEKDKKPLFEGLTDVLADVFRDKIFEIIMRRWNYLDDLRNS